MEYLRSTEMSVSKLVEKIEGRILDPGPETCLEIGGERERIN